MKKYLHQKESVFTFICIFFIWLMYASLLSPYIQGGDTSEMVTSARGLFVAHPPGYPLWIWMQWIFIHTLNLDTPFWRASLLTSIFAGLTLITVIFPLRKTPFIALSVILTLGLSTAFFESSILPDVFSFHALIVSLIGYFYLFHEKESLKRQQYIPLLFFLGLGHHHTIIFLLPLLVHMFFEIYKSGLSLRPFLFSAILGFVLMVFLYMSLMIMHPDSYFSWSEIKTPKDVLWHFLRKDYGSLSFAPNQNLNIPLFSALEHFFKTTFVELTGLLLLSLFACSNNFMKYASSKFFVWFFTLLFSLCFFLMVNFKIESMGVEIIKRFHVMPATILALTCVYLLSQVQKTKMLYIINTLVIIFSISLGALTIKNLSHLKNDSLFQNYASNLLLMAKVHNAKLIFTDNDNSYFGVRAMQFDSSDQDTASISTPLLFHPWYFNKIQKRVSFFNMNNKEEKWASRNIDFISDVVNPNIALTNIIVTKGNDKNEHFQTVLLPLGRLLISKNRPLPETSNDQVIVDTVNEESFLGAQGFSKKMLFAEYSHYYLSKGAVAFQNNQKELALGYWKKALTIVPYALPALINICSIEQSAHYCSKENIERIKEESKGIFN